MTAQLVAVELEDSPSVVLVPVPAGWTYLAGDDPDPAAVLGSALVSASETFRSDGAANYRKAETDGDRAHGLADVLAVFARMLRAAESSELGSLFHLVGVETLDSGQPPLAAMLSVGIGPAGDGLAPYWSAMCRGVRELGEEQGATMQFERLGGPNGVEALLMSPSVSVRPGLVESLSVVVALVDSADSALIFHARGSGTGAGVVSQVAETVAMSCFLERDGADL